MMRCDYERDEGRFPTAHVVFANDTCSFGVLLTWCLLSFHIDFGDILCVVLPYNTILRYYLDIVP